MSARRWRASSGAPPPTPGGRSSPGPRAPRQAASAAGAGPGLGVRRSATPAATSARARSARSTYVDGDQIWGFGHPLDSVGRRDLFLQGAYVYDVVNNPLGVGDAATYKLAAPDRQHRHAARRRHRRGHRAHGRAAATRSRCASSALDQDTGRRVTLRSQVADETAVGNPSGSSPASGLAAVAAGQAAYEVLRGSPARQSGGMCMRITIAERAKPMGFCNTYVGGDARGGRRRRLAGGLGRQRGRRPARRLRVRPAARDVDRASTCARAAACRRRSCSACAARASCAAGATYRFKLRLQRVRGPKLTRTREAPRHRGVPARLRAARLSAARRPTPPASRPTASWRSSWASTPAARAASTGPRSVAGARAHAIAKLHRYDGGDRRAARRPTASSRSRARLPRPGPAGHGNGALRRSSRCGASRGGSRCPAAPAGPGRCRARPSARPGPRRRGARRARRSRTSR